MTVKQSKTISKKNAGLFEKSIFIFAFGLIIYGWMHREEEIFSADIGWGYWLGILGGSLMLILMLYPLRKHSKRMRHWGAIHYWFRLHMLFGIFGPIAVLYHANFDLGSTNSNVALFAMITVASSGLVGRYFYTKIHRGLYGKKLSLSEIEKPLQSDSLNFESNLLINSAELFTILHTFKNKLFLKSSNLFGALLLLPVISLYSIGLTKKVDNLIKTNLETAKQNNNIELSDIKQVKHDVKQLTKQYRTTCFQYVEFVVFERLFSLWHFLHLPLFLIMIFTGFFHVYAVHAY